MLKMLARLTLGILLLSHYCSATSVVIVVRHDQIVVAASSKLMLKPKNGPMRPLSKPACKIHKATSFGCSRMER